MTTNSKTWAPGLLNTGKEMIMYTLAKTQVVLWIHAQTLQALSTDIELPKNTTILSVEKQYHQTGISYLLVAKIEETTNQFTKGIWMYETFDKPELISIN